MRMFVHMLRRALLASALAFATTALAQTPCPFPAPTLVAPPNGATGVRTPVTFEWTRSPGAVNYEVWASFDDEEVERLEAVTSTTLFDDVPPHTSVEWYVVANFTTCSVRSAKASFTTGDCDPPATTLIAPADAATIGSPVDFEWSEIEDADGYRVWLLTEDEELFVVAETRFTEAEVRLSPGLYVWFVEAFFDDCGSSFSDFRFFVVRRAEICLDPRPSLTAPATGSTTANPTVTFEWTKAPGAIGYQVWAALDDGDFEFIDATDETSLTARLGEGVITWVVVSQFDGCDDTISEGSFFTIALDPNCEQNAPFPIAPADDADDVPTKVSFLWTPVESAIRYDVYVVTEEGEGDVILAGSSETNRLTATVPAGELAWVVEAVFANCPSQFSPVFFFETVAPTTCTIPAAPEIYVDPQVTSGDEYLVLWSATLNTASYELEEATDEDFENATKRVVDDILFVPTREVTSTTRFYYRVRALSSCGLGFGSFSDAASITITPAVTLSADDAEVSASFGAQDAVVQKVRIPGTGAPQAFTARTDQPWLTVTPASGTIPPDGIDLTLTANPRHLPVGTSTGTILLDYPASGPIAVSGTGPATVPVSISLVTPVTPNPGTSPTQNSLIIPAVAHAEGAGTRFESDVRLANTSAQVMKYLLTFTPTRTDGTTAGQQATIQVEPGETAALNDVLKNFYGFAAAGESVIGVLEIRPLATSSTAVEAGKITFASSRTYAVGPGGTYGQFIPAIPFSQFIGKAKDPLKPVALSLQQIAQSPAYRTNIGLVEGSGEPASVVLSVFGDRGQLLRELPMTLKAGEHMQLGSFLAQNGISVENGRVEVAVTSSTGKVTAYASVLDNKTNDPMLVLPIDASQIASNRTILPGIADIDNGAARWRSDVRIFNASNAPATATLTFHKQGDAGAPMTTTKTIEARGVLSIDNALQSLYNVGNVGGSLVISTAASSKLVATARTYNDTGNGTYGQFIPGLTIADGVGMRDRALQILQVEESERFRTNLGLVELTGNAATVEISAHTPDSKVTPHLQVSLQPNEFLQLGSILSRLGLGTIYNGRLSLRVMSGSGKVSGYASLIDNRTNDGTYIPAQ